MRNTQRECRAGYGASPTFGAHTKHRQHKTHHGDAAPLHRIGARCAVHIIKRYCTKAKKKLICAYILDEILILITSPENVSRESVSPPSWLPLARSTAQITTIIERSDHASMKDGDGGPDRSGPPWRHAYKNCRPHLFPGHSMNGLHHPHKILRLFPGGSE